MKQITLRGIPHEVERMIKKEAERRGLSLNKAILSTLEKAAGVKGEAKKKKTLYHDLDHISGIWAKEEAEAFEKGLKFQRKIEEAIWKRTG